MNKNPSKEQIINQGIKFHLQGNILQATKYYQYCINQKFQDQRVFSWGSNDRKLMNVPFDEHPYSALAAWFKTDEGMEVYSSIEKRLN